MPRRSRARQVLKWGGTVTCLLILAAFAVSAVYHVTWSSKPPTQFGEKGLWISLDHGALRVGIDAIDVLFLNTRDDFGEDGRRILLLGGCGDADPSVIDRVRAMLEAFAELAAKAS